MNFIKNWKDERIWLKEYGEPRPDWAKKGDLSVLKTPEFYEWLSRRTPAQQKIWLEKTNIIYSELERLQFAIEDEIIKRGGKPNEG